MRTRDETGRNGTGSRGAGWDEQGWSGRGGPSGDGWCSVCAAEVGFERAPCGDGHGVDCPERVCLACSSVVVVGLVVGVVDVLAGAS